MDDISREELPEPDQERAPELRPQAPSEVVEAVDDSRRTPVRLTDLRFERVARAAEPADSAAEPDLTDELADETDDSHDVDIDLDDASDEPDRDPLPESGDEDELPEINGPEQLSRVLFALLLTSREALSALRLAEACDCSQKDVKAAIELLDQEIAARGYPLELTRSGDRFKLLTTPAVHPFLKRLKGIKRAERLSPAALETLAVVAYRQPVFRAEIEAIRGVKAGPMLRTLLDHKLIKVVGRADVPGRPLQYGTTQAFLERFGLGSLKDLPSIREFKSL